VISAVSPLLAPAPLTEAHDLSDFNSGEPTLDAWLRQRARRNAELLATKTYVTCSADSYRVVGYYAVCMGQILNQEGTGSMRRNMPQQIPAVILGRLAIDVAWQGRGLGRRLLADVVNRSLQAAHEISARLLVVHAISPAAEAFYIRHGFTRLPVEAPTFALDLVKLERLASQE
jgi:GNAT superfamily N-acetyltransferase